MIRLAVQSKGRLNEESLRLLKDAGINVDDSKRKFLGKASDFPLELLYLRDDDIPGVVADGSADIGIVGYNEIAETQADVEVIRRLGFGKCRLSLAIPKGVEYPGLEWFEGKSIATSYPSILRRFLSSKGVSSDIREIRGSVEIAPAAGIADSIFDIVSSGGTLVSNGLKEVETVLESEAVLVCRKDLLPENKPVLDSILFRFDAIQESRGKKYILMNIPSERLSEAMALLPSMRSPTVMPLALEGWCSVHSVVDDSSLWATVESLKKTGAEGILILNVDKVID
ncbi:MAG: ATP phosphoribosyltransferase [Bacteroidales bacterium]|nr:ATP phosphoribosyltransferase [Bacteroidales bacterium]